MARPRQEDEATTGQGTGDTGTPAPMSGLLTLHEAADCLNVHYMTAYRWVRKGDLPAFKTGGRLRVRVSDIERYIADRRLDVAMSVDPEGHTDWGRHVDRLVALLLDGDGAAARHEVFKVVSDGATAANAYVRLITPALHRIGAGWQHGDVNVAEEHRASQICATIVAQLGDMFRSHGPARGMAATLTPPSEAHSLASSMVADFLRAAGYTVHHLGAGVPTTDLRMFLKVVPVDLLCFSVTQPIPVAEYAELVSACREVDPDVDVVFGGQGVDRQGGKHAGATVVADLAGMATYLDQR